MDQSRAICLIDQHDVAIDGMRLRPRVAHEQRMEHGLQLVADGERLDPTHERSLRERERCAAFAANEIGGLRPVGDDFEPERLQLRAILGHDRSVELHGEQPRVLRREQRRGERWLTETRIERAAAKAQEPICGRKRERRAPRPFDHRTIRRPTHRGALHDAGSFGRWRRALGQCAHCEQGQHGEALHGWSEQRSMENGLTRVAPRSCRGGPAAWLRARSPDARHGRDRRPDRIERSQCAAAQPFATDSSSSHRA